MSLDVAAIKKGIYSALTTDAPLMALISGVWSRKIPDGVIFPYVWFVLLPSYPEDNFGSFRDDVGIQLSCRAMDTTSSTAQETASAIAKEVCRIMDDNNNLSILGYDVPCCNRTIFFEDVDDLTDVYELVIGYDITIATDK